MTGAALRGAVGVVLGLGCLWSIGFNAFDHVARAMAVRPAPADGIVVLTGGADRIEVALQLLLDGVAPELLISGVGRGGELPELARRAQIDISTVRDRITVGHAATSTVGNASETAAWARSRPIRRLIVVTAGYHMVRALYELQAQLPGVELVAVPVQPPAMRNGGAMGTLHLLAGEFDKLLAVRLGVARAASGGM